MNEPLWTHDRLRPGIYRPDRDSPVVYERKFDGLRITFFKQPSGRLVAFGRQIEDHLEKMDELAAPEGRDWLWAIRDRLAPHSSIDGEIWSPGVPCTSVITRVKEKHPDLRFTPFAVPYHRGLWMGHSPFAETDTIIRDLGLVPPARGRFVPERHTTSWFEDQARELGIEGFVLKEQPYDGWWKVKATSTVDAVIIGLVPGKGKHEGRLGGLIVGLYDGDELRELTRVGTGFSDDEREEIDESLVGHVAEVQYQSIAGRGRLQHPRFVRFRDDKRPEECVISQLPEPADRTNEYE